MDPETRSFHEDSTSIYRLPNDTPEQARLNGQAKHVTTVMSNKILQSPKDNLKGKRLLDIGCGTGYTTYQLAVQYPEADVFGLDLSQVSQRQERPPNVHFLQGNVLNQPPTAWKTQGDGPNIAQDEEAFDLLYGRFLIAGIRDWLAYIKIQFRLLKSGGWAEIHELDPLIYNEAGVTTTHEEEWHTIPEKATADSGPEYGCAARAAARMKDAGFVDVAVREYKLPLGGEGEETPELQAAGDFFDSTFTEVREFLLRTFVKDADEQDRLIAIMRQKMAPEPGKHCKLIVTIGRKP